MCRQGAWREERGFTLVEVLLVIIFVGIVMAIASSLWFGAVESRRADSATTNSPQTCVRRIPRPSTGCERKYLALMRVYSYLGSSLRTILHIHPDPRDDHRA
jgi:prepilin-type N-terminal cleavage/methylation domain-containing protein